MAVVAMQYGQRRERDALQARRDLGSILGPIPRYLYQTLTEDQLAEEVERRWTARRLEMSQRIVMDGQLLRYMDPEKVQDHWRNFWTGEVNKKLQHSDKLAIGVFNWPRAIIESLTALLVGGKPLPYRLDVTPWDRESQPAALQAEMVEQFIDRWQLGQRYPLVLNDRAANIFALGCNWNMVTTPPGEGMLPQVRNVDRGAVASFWQSDRRTLECAITSTEMLPGEAAAMYPEKVDAIARAVHNPSSWARSIGAEKAMWTWDLSSTVTILNNWYRNSKGGIGVVTTLLGAPQNKTNSIVLAHTPDAEGYPDIPLWCVPRFRTNDRPPDESQGVLYDIAPIVTLYDETVSAAQDMLRRAIYQRYKLTNAYGRPPTLIPNTSIIALRSGQDLSRLDDALNNIPVDTFIQRLEDLMRLFPGLSDYFLGRVPPTETSGEAIHASINASITRLQVTRTEFLEGERWQNEQIVAQASAYYSATYNGRSVSMAPILRGDYAFRLQFVDENPREAVKAKQLALAAEKAGIISLETAMGTFGVTSTQDELRKIRRDRQDDVLRPDIVQLTAAARGAKQSLKAAELAAQQPPQKPPIPVRVSLSGQLDPLSALKLAEQASEQDLVPGGPVGAPAGAPGQDPAAQGTPDGGSVPLFENDNDRMGVPAIEGEPE